MQTVQLQARPTGCEHWFNIPATMRGTLKAQGFEIRELVGRPTQQEWEQMLRELAAHPYPWGMRGAV